MSILIKNGILAITHNSRCKDELLLNTLLDMKVRFPVYMDMFTLELNQYLARLFPDYLLKIRSDRDGSRERIELGHHTNQEIDDKYIYNYGGNYIEKFYNLFLVEVYKGRNFIVGNERRGLPSYLGFKLVQDGEFYRFIELDCYCTDEEKKSIKWWEDNNAR